MLASVLLIMSLVICAVASLTTFKAPTIFTWKLAILVGEFGHFLVVLPLALGLTALFLKTPGQAWTSPLRVGSLIACVAAGIFLLKPVAQARRVARELPTQIQRELGVVPGSGESPFSIQGLWWKRVLKGAVDTSTYAEPAAGAAGLQMDIYQPVCLRVPTGPRPCIVVIHGGGWDSGDRRELVNFNRWLASEGYVVASVDYRLAPQHVWPAQREDVAAAIAYLKTHHERLGIDPARFVLLGRSAGGQIAEAVAYAKPDPAIRGVIALYAPADLNFAWKNTPERDVLDSKLLMRQYLGGTPDDVAAKYDDASPYLYAGEKCPPTLLMHGQIDCLVWHRQSERLAEKLRAAHVPCVFLDLPWATHAFDFNLDGPGGQLGRYAICAFVGAVTR